MTDEFAIYEGFVDGVEQRALQGWVWCPGNPSAQLCVELLEGDRAIARSDANILRDDLVTAGRGTGRYAFAIPIPVSIEDGEEHALSVRVVGSDFICIGSPIPYSALPRELDEMLPQRFASSAPVVGSVDCIDEEILIGWAHDPGHPDMTVRLVLYDDEQYVTSFQADLPRPDLKNTGIGSGQCGFTLTFPASILDGQEHILNLRVAGSAVDLLTAPLSYTAMPTDIVPSPAPTPTLPAVDLAEPRAEPKPVQEEPAPAPAPMPAPPPAEDIQPVQYKGHLEPIRSNILSGWVWSRRHRDIRATVEFLVNDHPVATVVADQYREDLEKNGIGDGAYGFSTPLPDLSTTTGPYTLVARVQGGDYVLINGRKKIEAKANDLAPGSLSADGDIFCPGYLDDKPSRRLLAGMRLEHETFGFETIGPVRQRVRLANRLKRERLALLENTTRTTLIVLVTDEDHAAALASIRAWRLQSHPTTRHLFLVAAPKTRDRVSKLMGPKEKTDILDADDVEGWRAACEDADLIAFARPGDVLHPSLASTLTRLNDTPDVVVWNLFEPTPGSKFGGTVYRRPRLDAATNCSASFVDTTFAVRGAAAATCPSDVLRALGGGNVHAFMFWLASNANLRWHTHPEALTVRTASASASDRELLASNMSLYATISENFQPGLSLEVAAVDLPVPFVLIPVKRARKISVVICYRDHAEITLRCLHSIARQRVTGEIEIVLVDNQSTPRSAERVLSGARKMFPDGAVLHKVYDAPFNHSAQNNLGVEAATGDVVVICNNDIIIVDDTVLEETAAWALRDGVATVSCQIENTVGGRGSYGHIARPLSDVPFQPAFAENTDPTYRDIVHGVPGNSLCLAAIERHRYRELGGLDEVRFPIGYNDVEFSLRCRESSLTHLYLGHLRAKHARGSSRSGDNEDLQSLWIREMYPNLLSERLFQLQRETIEPVGSVAPKAQAVEQNTAPVMDEETARLTVEARLADEARRARLVGAMDDVSGLTKRLNKSLEQLQSIAIAD